MPIVYKKYLVEDIKLMLHGQRHFQGKDITTPFYALTRRPALLRERK